VGKDSIIFLFDVKLGTDDGLLCRTIIKGGENDEAVLCTRIKTYALKYVETTNMQLLVPPDNDIREGEDESDFAGHSSRHC
jgi:hypothetical protein